MRKQEKNFINQYLITALWSSCDENGDSLDDNFDASFIDLYSIKESIKDCLEFIKLAEDENLLDDVSYSTAGHDFWLTRNGHGVGFWDGDYPKKIGDRLTELSKNFNELDCSSYVLHDDTVKIEIR